MPAKSARCECERSYTCGYCTRNAKPYQFTPLAPSWIKVLISGYAHGNGTFLYTDNGNAHDPARAIEHARSYVNMFKEELDRQRVQYEVQG